MKINPAIVFGSAVALCGMLNSCTKSGSSAAMDATKQSQVFQLEMQAGFGSDANPLHDPGIFQSIGLMETFADLYSSHLPIVKRSIAASAPGVTSVNYSWTKDSSGRVTGGKGVDSASGKLSETIEFKYAP